MKVEVRDDVVPLIRADYALLEQQAPFPIGHRMLPPLRRGRLRRQSTMRASNFCLTVMRLSEQPPQVFSGDLDARRGTPEL